MSPRRFPARLFLASLLAAWWLPSLTTMTAAAIAVETCRFGPWQDCFRLSNGTVDVVVAPQVGRIVRYGYVGGENLLWENPNLAELPADKFRDIGGDKAWPWPQDAWAEAFGAAWPPPREADGLPHEARTLNDTTIRMTSPVFPGEGCRFVRDIQLDAAGSGVTIETRLEGQKARRPWAAWTITQVPPGRVLLARLVPSYAAGPGFRTLLQSAWTGIERVGEELIAIPPIADRQAKLGIEADLLAVAYDRVMLVQQVTAHSEGTYEFCERAQLFNQPRILFRKPNSPYCELEFSSPRRSIAPGQPAAVTIHWQLLPLSGEATPQQLAKVLAPRETRQSHQK